MVLMLSNGATNNEIDYLYKTAKQMVDDNSKSKHLIFRNVPNEVNMDDLVGYMKNLRIWHFYVVADMKSLYQWQNVAHPREILQIDDEYAMKFRL